MIALDLFCGAGGASKGLLNGGFDRVIGVDLVNQKEYFDMASFCQADAFDVLEDTGKFLTDMNYFGNISDFDFIWASPPCQAYSYGTQKARNLGKTYPDLVGKTREALLKTGKPFVIENVVGAPLRRDLMLCGEMFDLRIIRHRIFECNGFKPAQILHKKHKLNVWNGSAIGVWSGGRPGCFGDKEKRKYYITVAGHGGNKAKGNTTLKSWQDAMEIPWIKTKKTLAQCVPPKYSEYIAKEFIRQQQGWNKWQSTQ
jgi:DNA (cytosine-5)-methyltransferase 1